MNSNALIESYTLRQSVINRTDALDKVKKLTLLPDDVNASIEMVATYYEVSRKAVDSLILDNREELESDGLKVLTGQELSSFKEMGVIGKNSSAFTIIPRRAILRIGMLLRDSIVARAVRDHLLNLEAADRTVRYDDPGLLQFKKEVYFLEAATEILRLPDSGKLKLLGDFNKSRGLNLPLPAYADEPVTESASELLKKHGISIPTKTFNVMLIGVGLLEEKQRPSSGGGTKTFKSLTEAGLVYGKNIISPVNPRETQPHYYSDKFVQLLTLLGLVSP